MIVVIQCAGSKQPGAGTLRTMDGKPVKFVARPELAPDDGFAYARPDDISDQGVSWRELLFRYNEDTGDNRLGLLPACELYTPPIYKRLADGVGRQRLFILSAGWGMVSADYLTPDYDITFSAEARGANSYKRRKNEGGWADFSMLPKDTTEPILFFGGKNYLPQFLELTNGLSAPRSVYYYSKDPKKTPDVPGCLLVRFEAARATNWQYDCAKALLDGALAFAYR